ncbi:hypothetical protein [Gaopeijia maritima]|uniref:hypothetical protein n=1 Tax=Gaopeijia maritima TaxID=3119007 RepID=UPI00328394E5
MASTDTTKTPAPSKDDRARGYREGAFQLRGKPVPNYHCVFAPCKHATLDEAAAKQHARHCRFRSTSNAGS